MPAYSTHYIFAKELKEEIENCVEFKLNNAALFIGTQGPDIFFDHRVMPWMRKINEKNRFAPAQSKAERYI